MRVFVYNYEGNQNGRWIGRFVDSRLENGERLQGIVVEQVSGEVLNAFNPADWEFSRGEITSSIKNRLYDIKIVFTATIGTHLNWFQNKAIVQRTLMNREGRRSFLFFYSELNPEIRRA